jgi:alanyl-tRNA synthetase
VASAVTARAKALHGCAGALVKPGLSGRGGGSDDIAQGGGLPADQADHLLDEVVRAIGER